MTVKHTTAATIFTAVTVGAFVLAGSFGQDQHHSLRSFENQVGASHNSDTTNPNPSPPALPDGSQVANPQGSGSHASGQVGVIDQMASRSETGDSQASQAPKVLKFFYFVESNRVPDPEAVAAIESQAIALQQYWYDQFGGTFSLNDPVVETIMGDHDSTWYEETPIGNEPRWYRLNNIRAEVRAKAGIQPGDDARMVTFPASRIDGRVGANQYAGAWMDGDDITCASRQTGTVPYDADYVANCLATLSHELGHVYGLDHDGPDNDCMQLGFYQYVSGEKMCDFSNENRAAVVNNPMNRGWLDARPDRSDVAS